MASVRPKPKLEQLLQGKDEWGRSFGVRAIYFFLLSNPLHGYYPQYADVEY